jgi:hypothetical protein
LYSPGGQSSHIGVAFQSASNVIVVPTGHFKLSHAVARFAVLKLVQLVQNAAPGAALYVPAGQSVQTLAPALLYLPAGQVLQALIPTVLYEPAGHDAEQALTPATLYVPTPHG